MCFGMGCMFEGSRGECGKSLRTPCPIEAPGAYEQAMSARDNAIDLRYAELRENQPNEVEHGTGH